MSRLTSETRGAREFSKQRLQPTQFRHSQYRYDYNYHPDGKLKQLIDLDDVVGSPSQVTFHYMSRSYGYDVAGRISRVDGTDNPVVNGGTVPAPFVGYYGYDEFNNLNSRSGHYALNADTSDSATFANNKRTNTGWSHDADGRVLTSVDTATSTSQTWTYDAAGRQIGISEVSSGTTSTNTVNYDGNGELLFESVTTPQSTKSNYLIRSTVLGTVLTKLDASGNKDITYVPANGLAFPMQTKDSNGNPIVNEVRRDVTGLQEDGKAVDPFGAVIQNVQPPSGGGPPPNIPFFGATYGGVSWNAFTNANNFSTGCTLDGVRTNCRTALDAVTRGMATGVIHSPGTKGTAFNLLGVMPMTQRTTRIVGPGNKTYYDSSGKAYPAYGTQRTETTISTEFIPFGPDPQSPQNTGRQIVPLGNLQKALENLLKGECGVFVQKLIDKANELFGGGRPHATSFWDAFSRIQDAGGYQLTDVLNGGTVGGELFVGELAGC